MKLKDAIACLAALAQESRLGIFRLLVRRGPEGYTPSELAERLGVPAPTLSFHLKELQNADLIDVRREGRFLYYRPNFPNMNRLIGFLSENCCSLADRDCGSACAPAAADAASPKRKRA
jgi:ArsR family transcriptional regulator, arsenate/arsenite/antimonite-responsive transcriptional repressor